MRKLFTLLAALVLLLGQVVAQGNRTIKGKVTDDKGAAISKASVLAKGTSLGTATSDSGAFTLQVPVSAKTLVISAVGFETSEVAIEGSTLQITLQSATGKLDEVVVVCYGTPKDNKVPGVISNL